MLCQKVDSASLQIKIDSLITISNVAYGNQDYSNSALVRIQAVDELKKLSQWENVISEYNIIYSLSSYANDLLTSNMALDSALWYSDQYLDDDNLNRLYVLGNVSYNNFLNRNYSSVIDDLEFVLEKFEEQDVPIGNYYNNIITLIDAYKLKGENQYAKNLAEKYFNILQKSEEDFTSSKAELLQRIGVNERDNSEYDKAIKNFRRALEVNKSVKQQYPREDNYALILKSMSMCFLDAEKVDSALFYMEKSISFRTDHNMKVRYYHKSDLADILKANQNYNLAKKEYKNAIQRFNKNENAQKKDRAVLRSNLAEIYLEENNADSAGYYIKNAIADINLDSLEEIENYENFLNITGFNINHIKIIANYANYSYTTYKKSNNNLDLNIAIKRYEQAINGGKYLQKELLSKSAKYALNKKQNEIYDNYLNVLLHVYRKESDQEIFHKIFQTIEDNKSIILKEDISTKANLSESKIPDNLLSEEKSYLERLNILKRNIYNHKIQQGQESGIINNWKEEITNITQDYTQFQKKLEKEFPEYYKNKYLLEISDFNDLQLELNSKDLYINFYALEEDLLCVWISNNNHGIISLKNKGEIFQNVENFIALIKNGNVQSIDKSKFQNFKDKGFSLYQDLFLKIPSIENFENIIISPHNILYYLPFEALIDNLAENANSFKSLPYLIQNHNIEYSFSSDLWIKSKHDKTGDTDITISSFAPFTGNSSQTARSCFSEGQLNPLKCSKEEIELLSTNFENKQFPDAKASLLNFKKIKDENIIHLATHACLDDEDPEFNKLLFSDDYLAINDLQSMELNADLVVLSACNTGTGKIKSGEGVVNLGKGFRNAGIPSMITSLWSISDCATSDIIQNFYHSLAQKENISQSLRSAKLAYLESADKRHAHPYFWAGLIFSGDKDAFINDSKLFQANKWLIFGLFAIVMIAFMFLRRK